MTQLTQLEHLVKNTSGEKAWANQEIHLDELKQDAGELEQKNTLNILIADDEIFVHELYSLLISKYCDSKYKFNYLHTYDGKETLDKTTNDTNILLLDVNMPIMDGFTVAKSLREKNYRGFIVLNSADSLNDYKNKAIKAGADLYLEKPLQKDKLQELIKYYLKKYTIAH